MRIWEANQLTLMANNAYVSELGAHAIDTKTIVDHKAGHTKTEKSIIDNFNTDSNDKFLNVTLSCKNKLNLGD